MTDELKETIIREHPDGIWLVFAEENPPDIVTLRRLREMTQVCLPKLTHCRPPLAGLTNAVGVA